MNRKVFLFIFILTVSFLISNAQSGELTTLEKDITSFKGIDFGDAMDVFVKLGDEYSLKVETFPEFHEKFNAEVKNDILKLNLKAKKNPKIFNVYITFKDIESIDVNGAASLNSENEIIVDYLTLNCDGASNVYLELNVDEFISDIHGASDVRLIGQVKNHISEIHGAADFDGSDLVTEDAQIYVHGAASANINATAAKRLISKVEGAGSLYYSGNPEVFEVEKSTAGTVSNYKNDFKGGNDTVKVNIGRVKVEVYEDDDSTKVIVGDIKIKAGDDGDVTIERLENCKKKYNGHWAGFGLGVNGYLSPDYQMDFPMSDEYLELKLGKSIAVHLNLIEQNISILKNQHLGLTTGLGLIWNNYRFINDTRLFMDEENAQLVGYRLNDVEIRKTKLTAMYLTVPLILEFQTGGKKFKDFYIAGGVLGNLRLSSHTKIYYDELNKDITLSKYDSETGDYISSWQAVTPEDNKVKNFDSFYLNPFKVDATARIGWGLFEFFGTYSLTEMFRNDKAPELIPWTIGISLVDF